MKQSRKRSRLQWPSDDDVNTLGLVFVVVLTTTNSIARCTMNPVTDGEEAPYRDSQITAPPIQAKLADTAGRLVQRRIGYATKIASSEYGKK